MGYMYIIYIFQKVAFCSLWAVCPYFSSIQILDPGFLLPLKLCKLSKPALYVQNNDF